MWTRVKTVPNLMVAEMWKELFEGEGIPTRILPDSEKLGSGEAATYQVLVPTGKEHIIEEVLRKI